MESEQPLGRSALLLAFLVVLPTIVGYLLARRVSLGARGLGPLWIATGFRCPAYGSSQPWWRQTVTG